MNTSRKWTLPVLLAVLALVPVLIVVESPFVFNVQRALRDRAGKIRTLHSLRQLAAASEMYAADHDGALPSQGGSRGTSWQALADPENSQAWYNALPRALGLKGAADFAGAPKSFYSEENLLYLTSAIYPTAGKRMERPHFAIALNTNLLPKNARPTAGPVKRSQITDPRRTILIFESGMQGEPKSSPTQGKYDGRPDATVGMFVTRSSDHLGGACFVDGHVEFLDPATLLPP